jgi:putative DNA primase/helicase
MHTRDFTALDGTRDCYFTPAAFAPEARTNIKDKVIEVWALVIDDVGDAPKSNVPGWMVEMALGPPTAVTRSSKDNHQWAYRLSRPIPAADWDAWRAGVEARINPPKRLDNWGSQCLFRLPMGVNTDKGRGGTFPVELIELNPGVELDVDSIAPVHGGLTGPGPSKASGGSGGWAHDIAGLMALIPNNDLHYDEWFAHAERCMAAAIDKDAARPAFETWSEKSGKHDEAEIERRWPTVDPTRTSGKELLAEAAAADPAGFAAWQAREGGAAFPDKPPGPVAAGGVDFFVDQERSSIAVVEYLAGRLKKVGRDDWREFDEVTGRWREWTGDHMLRRVLEMVHERKKVALDPEVSKKLGSVKFIDGVARAAGLHRSVIAKVTDFDRAPLLLGVPSGVIDLKKGASRAVRKGRAPEMVCKAMWVDPAPAGTPHPEWSRFLAEFTQGDAALEEWLQVRAGYCLTGLMDEYIMPFYHGSGGNGKSVYLNALRSVWGEYGAQIEHRLLFEKQGGYHLAPLAVLAGVRLAIVTDVPQGASWDVHIMKMLTGDDAITANRMHQNPITFKSTAKVDVSGNGEPTVRDMDEGVRRRLKLIPLTATPKNIDKQLSRKLAGEWPAILSWALVGLDMYWGLGGFPVSKTVDDATRDYHNMLDPFQRWLDVAVVKDHSQGAKVATTDLFRSWDAFRSSERNHNASPANPSTLARKMKDKGFVFSSTGGKSLLWGYKITKTDADNVF